MLRRIMLYLMMAETALKIAGLAYILSTEVGRLPIPVYVSTGIIAGLGLILVFISIVGTVFQKQLVVYYVIASGSVVFNLIFMKLFSRAELNLLDLAVIGTLMDIVVNATLVAMTVRERRYVRIHVDSEK